MSKNTKTKNDIAWEKLFEKYKLLNLLEQEEKIVISANQIREFREPRLMAKFDQLINLPEIFKKNQLSILPISRGDYTIGRFETHEKMENKSNEIINLELPDYLESLSEKNVTSEAFSINCAFASGMLADFLEDEGLFATVSGRMGSDCFDFQINNNIKNKTISLQVKNSQIEIDAAYEGLQYLSLIEAKNDLFDDFLIRQLYYPYKLWQNKVTKKIKPIFLVYSNGIFTLSEYCFTDPNLYNSIMLVKQKKYSIEKTKIEIEEIQFLLDKVKIVDEPTISFPQANSFERVLNLCELLVSQNLNRDEITDNYAFDARQSDYYTNAGRYLGLLEKRYVENRKACYFLTSKCKGILNLPYKQRQLEFVKCILSHKVFNDVLRKTFEEGCIPTQNVVVEAMMKANLYKIHSLDTFERRSSTIKGWINWILGLV